MRPHCFLCSTTGEGVGAVLFYSFAVDVYGDAIGAFFDNCLAGFFCTQADHSAFTKACSLRYTHPVPVDKVLLWKCEIVEKGIPVDNYRVKGDVVVKGSLFDYDQDTRCAGMVLAEAERK